MGKLFQVGKVRVSVYARDHLPPHFHIEDPDGEAFLLIATLAVLRGSIPKGSNGRKALKWAADNRAAIVEEWNRVNPQFPVE